MAIGATALSALSAVGRSVIGVRGGFVATWLTMSSQERSHRRERAVSRRESLYGEFIDEASRLYTDSLTHELEDASKLVKLYGLLSRMRLFAPAAVLSAAEGVVEGILQSYDTPNVGVPIRISSERAHSLDLLRAFSDTCRKNLVVG